MRTLRTTPRQTVVSVLLIALLAACGELLGPLPGEGSGERDDPNGGTTPPPTAPAATWDVQAHHAPVMDLSWHPDETFVAVYARHQPLTVLHADSGESVDWRSATSWWPPGCALLGAISWSPAGDRVALPGVVLDTDTWSVAAELALESGHTSDALAFSPDGSLLAGGSRPSGGGQSGCICLVVWDPATGEVVFAHDAPPALEDHSRGYIVDIAWHPNGTLVAAASRQGTAVYDLASRGVALRLPAAHAVAWSPDGARLAMALMDTSWPWGAGEDGGQVAVVDAATGEVLAQEAVHEGEVLAVSWHPDGTRLVSGGSDMTVAVLATESLSELDRFDVEGPVSVVRFGPTGKLAVGTRGGSVYTMADIAATKRTRVPIGRGEVVSLALSPDERLVATAGNDSTVRVWQVDDGVMSAELPFPHAPRQIAWSRDGAWLALALNELLLYRTSDWTLHGRPVGDEVLFWPDTIAFSPDGRWLAATTGSGVHVIDPVTRAVSWHFDPSADEDGFWWVQASAWSPTSDRLALAMHDGAVWIIAVNDPVEPVLVRTVTVLAEPAALAWSGDGTKLVLTGSVAPIGERGTLVLDATSLEVVQEAWFTRSGTNHAAGFAADGAWFWTSGWADGGTCPAGVQGDGNALKVWRVDDGQLVFGLDRVGTITDAAFAADDAFVLIGTSLGRLMRWAVP